MLFSYELSLFVIKWKISNTLFFMGLAGLLGHLWSLKQKEIMNQGDFMNLSQES